ncbi:MAG: sigma-54 dependent transcriptional regulator [Polyangiales bacterium]
MADMVAEALSDAGFDGVAVASSKQALTMLKRDDIEALVTDLRMPDIDGLELLAASIKAAPDRPVIVMTAYGAIDTAIESVRRGAYHYLTKPFKTEELVIFLRRALEQGEIRREAEGLRLELRRRGGRVGFVAESTVMRTVLDTVDRLADAQASVLILGETGTGKTALARTLHLNSARAARPFVTVNCAAIPEALLESELFGHQKGAFTGANANRLGLFAEANGGTLFLDEIGELPMGLQAKLLHVLEAGTVRPVGSNKDHEIDVRIVAATNRDLLARVREGAFREDLLYRLDVVSFEVPALRHRRSDLPGLIAHFFAEAKAKHATSRVTRIGAEALARMLDHPWPGNVRELAHTIERVTLLAQGPEVRVEDLPAPLQQCSRPALSFSGDVVTMREMQRRYATWAFDELEGQRTRTAERLNIDAKTLNKLLQEDDDKGS